MTLEEVSEKYAKGGQGAFPFRTCPPPGLNPLWACGHVVAHHPADRQTSLRVGSSARLAA